MASPEPQPLVDDPSPSVGERGGSRSAAPVSELDAEFWGEQRRPRSRKNRSKDSGGPAVVTVAPPPPPISPVTEVDASAEVEVPAPMQAPAEVEAPVDRGDAKAVGRLKARKVRRIVRHVSPWSVFKVALLFYVCLWLILMVAGVILWRVAQDVGVVTNVEDFYAELMGKEFYEFDGRRIFRAGAVIGGILAVASTGFTVLMTVLFNVISDFTGGIRLSVIELEEARRETRRPRAVRGGSAE
ncbi:MAG: DUF3566 domain-containing protein [Acidimicrobiales bacterium]|jgi:hypothetical protein|nr:DUF3566 domain-containing protein [Acidimicrobiales bacterium]